MLERFKRRKANIKLIDEKDQTDDLDDDGGSVRSFHAPYWENKVESNVRKTYVNVFFVSKRVISEPNIQPDRPRSILKEIGNYNLECFR